uniref:suppressor of cytokine signaling 3-like n=1 Tax=Myxine glutinosa TaxID=7769 RepID=UPI00358E8475
MADEAARSEQQKEKSGSTREAHSFPTCFRTFRSHQEYLNVERSRRFLMEGGYYWGPLSSAEARRLLHGKPIGTFLVRDSSDKKHFFSLSVVTTHGPTCVRVGFEQGRFTLLGHGEPPELVPSFPCIIELLEHYVHAGSRGAPWLTHGNGSRSQLFLARPLQHCLGSLQHACRRAVHRAVPQDKLRQLRLPDPLLQFLEEYPSSV